MWHRNDPFKDLKPQSNVIHQVVLWYLLYSINFWNLALWSLPILNALWQSCLGIIGFMAVMYFLRAGLSSLTHLSLACKYSHLMRKGSSTRNSLRDLLGSEGLPRLVSYNFCPQFSHGPGVSRHCVRQCLRERGDANGSEKYVREFEQKADLRSFKWSSKGRPKIDDLRPLCWQNHGPCYCWFPAVRQDQRKKVTEFQPFDPSFCHFTKK